MDLEERQRKHGALRAPFREGRGSSGGAENRRPGPENLHRATGGAAGSPGAGGVLEEELAGGLRRLLTEHRTGGARRRGGADGPGADR